MEVDLGGTNSMTYACCGVATETDREGIVTSYTYDSLKRVVSTERAGITISNVYDAANRVIGSFRNGVRVSSNQYNVAGQLLSSIDALTYTTTIAETLNGSGETVRTTTYPDSSTRIETHYQDGQLKSTTGTAVHGVRYDYGATNSLTFVTEIRLQTNDTDSAESVTTYSDMVGRPVVTAYSDGNAASNFFNGKGQLWKQVDPDGVVTLFAYDGRGELETTAIDMDRDDVIDYGGTDRITRSQSEAASAHSTIVRRTTTSVWGTVNTDSAETVSINEISAVTPIAKNTDGHRKKLRVSHNLSDQVRMYAESD